LLSLTAALAVSCAPQLVAAPLNTGAPTSHKVTQVVAPENDVAPDAVTATIGWLPSKGKECIRRGPNRGFCAGPRRVPRPFGQAADLGAELGLGERATSARLLLAPPLRDWVQVAQQVQGGEWVWPVDPKGFVRGLGDIRKAIRRRKAMAKPHPDPAVAYPRHHEHEGIDLAAPVGTPIRAAQGGLVVYSDNELRGYGNLVMIVHPEGSVTVYAHCRATFVFPGQHVEAGQVIAEVGNTGFSRGPHLHFEYRVAGMPRDPQPLLKKDTALAKKKQSGRQGRQVVQKSARGKNAI
jgi:murein DD-endopeptidase MepM/ murein hydrolase activator NlpD